MLRIVKSKHFSSGRKAFCHEIEKNIQGGGRACLIVPEQQTVMAEGLMAKILPSSSVLQFEVTNFTRLANTAFRALGGLSGEYCDTAKKSLIMWRALTELSPVLAMTGGRKEITSGFVESCLSAVAQMQNLGIYPAALSDACDFDEIKNDRRLSSRVSDLASVYSLYKRLLGERYADTGDDAEAMIKTLEENPEFLTDTHIYIEGFSSFTEPQYRLIALLAARTDVSLSLVLPKGAEEEFEYTELRECERRLVTSARRSGADIKLAREEGYLTNRKASLDELRTVFWTTNTSNDKISLQNSEDLRIFQAHTPYDECAFVCEDIKRRIMNGASYSDIAIVARSAEDYKGILDSALSEAEIPAFTSYRRDINELEAIKLIYTAYAALRGFKREDVISFAKCSLSGISRDECDEFEIYVNKWQISGRRFTDEGIWNMNPDGYSDRRDEKTDEKLLRIHSVRERLITPLSALYEKSISAATVREQAEVLLDFLIQIDLERSLKVRAERLAALGEGALSEDNAALWRIICQALDTLVSVLGDSPADADAFLSQLKVVFSATDIGRIPAFADQVTVGSADMLRLYEKKHIYLIGVNSGKFPASVNDKSYFSESDRIKLTRCGLAITPELEIKSARELFIFSRAFSYATDSVTITYHSADTRFKAVEPSEIIGRIAFLTGDSVKPIPIDSLPLSQRIFSPESTLSRIGDFADSYETVKNALVDSGYEREISILEGDISNKNAKLNLQNADSKRTITLSQSRIDSYVKCPFGYYCRYVIGLKTDERAEFDSRNIGSFIHAILENFFSELSRDGRSTESLSPDERVALTRAAAEKYISSLGDDTIGSSVRTRIKIDRLCRAALPIVEGLCEEFTQSAFKPRFFELSLNGGEESPDPIRLEAESGPVTIYGVIDRVDAYKKGEDVYLRVIDYKTGKKAFSPDDMSEGMNLQMFLYLKALVESENQKFRERLGVNEGGNIRPAGVIYVKTNIRDVKIARPDDDIAMKAAKTAQEREGMILDDEDVIGAMTLKYTPVYSERNPDKISAANRKYLFDGEGWNNIMQTVEESVCRVADGIRRGTMDASPKEKGNDSPCDYCDFKPICRK